MTFIITAVSKHFAIQIADTLLTKPDGTFHSDNLVKTTIAPCRNAKIAISYSGVVDEMPSPRACSPPRALAYPHLDSLAERLRHHGGQIPRAPRPAARIAAPARAKARGERRPAKADRLAFPRLFAGGLQFVRAQMIPFSRWRHGP
jgi:hypothetical protein